MGVVAISSLKPLSDLKVRVPRLAEDIWLTKAGEAVSYIDIFVSVEKESSEVLSSIFLLMDGKVKHVENVSSMWYEDPDKLYEGVGGYMYSLGLKKIRETKNDVFMLIDGIDCYVPKQHSVQIPVNKELGLLELRFLKPIKPGETVGVKIEVLVSREFSKSETYPTEVFYFEIFPYCHWAIGADVLRGHGFLPDNLTPVKAYYLYLFLPPGYETDRERTTEFLTLDLSKCKRCTRFCPFPDRMSKLLEVPVEEIRKDREGIRWHIKSLSKWQGKSITAVFFPSKSFKIRLFEHLLEVLVIGFLINVIAGLVYNYDLLILGVSLALLLFSVGILVYIFKRYRL